MARFEICYLGAQKARASNHVRSTKQTNTVRQKKVMQIKIRTQKEKQHKQPRRKRFKTPKLHSRIAFPVEDTSLTEFTWVYVYTPMLPR